MSEDVLTGATIRINGGPEPSVDEFQRILEKKLRILEKKLRILEKKLRMKESPEDREVKDKVFTAAGDELRSFCERYERLEVEKREIGDQMKEVMAEAKGRGYDTKILRMLIALRKRDPDDVAEEQAVLDMYKDALGMAR